MKKEIPTPVVAGVIALAVAAAGFFIFRAAEGPQELPRPPINVGTGVPDYVKDMPPEMRRMVEEQTKRELARGRAVQGDGTLPTGPPPEVAVPGQAR